MKPLVICCSQRFKDELEVFVRFLRKRGVLVFAPNFRRHTKRMIQKPEHLRLQSSSYRAKVPGLVFSHFNNIRQMATLAGICLIFNPKPLNGQKRKHGYIGSNTQGEVGYAGALGVPVIMLKPHEEEWIMTIAHGSDHQRIFTFQYRKADAMDFDKVWEWLNSWLNPGGKS